MNNENNDEFLPGVGPMDNDTISNAPQNFNQNIPNLNPNEAPFNMNMEPNQFDHNINNNFDPNMGQVPFDMNQPNMNPNANTMVDPNMNAGFDPNMNSNFSSDMNNNFDPNSSAGFDPNLNNNFDSNVGFEQNQFNPNVNNNFNPNMSQVPFDMNQPNMDPNMNNSFDPNANLGFDPNMNSNFSPNMNNNFDPNMNAEFDPNLNNNFDPNVGFEQNQFDPNVNNNFDPNMGQVPFDMNQPNMNNSFDPNADLGFDPNINTGFDPNMNSNFNPDMNNNFGPNMNAGFDPNMNNNFDANMNTDFDPTINNNFNQSEASDYSEDFEKNWMGAIYDKAHSKKFNFCAAFFGPAYLFYRKVYLTGGLTTLIIIIVNIILSLLNLTNIGLILGINAALLLIYFLGLGFGFYPIYRDFVHKQFNKYKKQITDNNQLVAVASKKGGTSILSLIIYYVAMGVVSTVMVSVIFASLMTGLFKKLPQANITGNNTITNNSVFTNTIINETNTAYAFTEGYEFDYSENLWVPSTDNKSLIKGAYTLTYTVAYQASDLGVADMTSAESKSTILTIINNSVTSLATANNLQMDPNDNFVSSNGVYYTYINLSSDTEVTRYYFVLVPNEQKLFQFEVKTNDTVVDSETHMEVCKMLASIKSSLLDNDTPLDNTITNSIDNNTISENTTTNTVSNNLVSDENVINSNNTTSPVSNVLRNTNI